MSCCRPRVWGAAALYTALTLVLAYPLSIRPASTVLGDDPDGHLFIWTLAWNAHAFLHQPLSLFDANIYHPERVTLAYSENLIGSALFAAPVVWVTHNPVLALNLVVLASCVLCGVGAFLLGRRIGLETPAALLCGAMFAFAPARFVRISQLHLATVQWVPFALASLHAYAAGGRKRDLRLAAALVSLQTLTSGHGAAFVGLAAGLFVAWRIAFGGWFAPARWLRDLGLRGALLLLPALLVFVPYRQVQVEMGLRRTLENWIVTPESFLASPAGVHVWPLSLVGVNVNETASTFLFPGYLPLLLAVAALCWRRQGIRSWTAAGWSYAAALVNLAAVTALAVAVMATVRGPLRIALGSTLLLSARSVPRAWIVFAILATMRLLIGWRVPFEAPRRLKALFGRLSDGRHPHHTRAFYLLLTILGVLLAVGPPLGIWPLVYWLPGFNFIRVPSRFMILAMLGIAVVAAFGFERMTARLGPTGRIVAAALLGAVMVVEFASLPLETARYRVDIPAADRWLDGQPKPFVVAEAPVSESERSQTAYMLHSMAHWQKTVHGYSGIRPPRHEELYAAMRGFPDDRSLDALARFGVTYVVVHADLYPPDEWPEVEDRIEAFRSRLVLQHVAGAGRVYRLR